MTPKKELIWIEEYLATLPIAEKPRCYVSVQKNNMDQFFQLLEDLPLVKERVRKYQLVLPIQLSSLHTLKSELYDICQILNERTVLYEQPNTYKLVIELKSRQPTKFSKLITKIEAHCYKEDLEFSYVELQI